MTLSYGGEIVDLTPPWRRLTIREAVMKHGGAEQSDVASVAGLQSFAKKKGLAVDLNAPYGNLLVEVFEEVAEAKLIQPTFITGYPLESRRWRARAIRTLLWLTASNSTSAAASWPMLSRS